MNTQEVQHRPWGWWKEIEEFETKNEDYEGNTFYLPVKVKHLYVKPGESLSLQFHEHRAETWYVVQGQGKLELSQEPEDCHTTLAITMLKKGSFVQIRPGQLHRVTCSSPEPLRIIEIQEGVGSTPMVSEQDITRLQDKYGRCGQ